jgi:hypothetical protein
MTEVRHEKTEVEMLTESMESFKRERYGKKEGRQHILGHILGRTRRGKLYYYYCQGRKEVYLGTAEAILKAVKGGTNGKKH